MCNHGVCVDVLWGSLVPGAMAMSSNPCQVLYDHQPGAKIPIPPCPEDTHPLQIFEETHVHRNLYRWVVFVLWLKAHPYAWRWYRIIQKAHPDTVPTIPTLWNECQKVWPLERKKSSMSPNNG